MTRDALDGAMSHLAVLARVYDRLHLSGASERLDGKAFVEEFCRDVSEALVGDRPVTIVVRANPVELPGASAVIVGLPINDLVQNALKYAFPDGRAGRIEIDFRRAGDRCALSVSDDGFGLSSNDRRGSGGRLVEGFARQRRGRLERRGGVGLSARLDFPLDHDGSVNAASVGRSRAS